MKFKFLFFLTFIITILYFSCSNTPYPESYYNVDMTSWTQTNVVGDTGGEVTCYFEVQNTSIYIIYGYIEVEATAFDGTKYSDQLDCPYIGASVTFLDDLDFAVGNKRIVSIIITDEQFYYR